MVIVSRNRANTAGKERENSDISDERITELVEFSLGNWNENILCRFPPFSFLYNAFDNVRISRNSVAKY